MTGAAAEAMRDALPGGLVFAGPDPHHALGLVDLVPGLAVAALDRPPALERLAAEGMAFWSPPGVGGGEVGDGRSSLAILTHPDFGPWVRQLGEQRGAAAPLPILVFKSSHRLERAAAALGHPLLAADSGLSRRWENKVAFLEQATRLGLRLPPGEAVVRETARYGELAARLGPRLVVQAPHGYSGARTLLADDEAGLEAALARLRSPVVRVSRWVEGVPLTLNACVTARGVAATAPFAQVTGEPFLTRHALGSCGNDWSWTGLARIDPAPFRAAARAVGDALATDGFRGCFGLDFVLGPDGTPYLIEVNPRLVASMALHAQLEALAGRPPLLARHVMALVDPAKDAWPLDLHEGPLRGGQLILHNLASQPLVWSDERPVGTDGSPASRPLVGAVDEGAWLVLPPPAGRQVEPGSEWGRVQGRQSVLDDAGHVLAELRRLARRLMARSGWPESRTDARPESDEPSDFV